MTDQMIAKIARSYADKVVAGMNITDLVAFVTDVVAQDAFNIMTIHGDEAVDNLVDEILA